ncbi:hypothetical protein [Xanthocytophaga agilis]|uniref:Uncharacterized protein n=1 Tax=Xanthocytophaga agilis TaxID=3048010 RepID=A0AAE3R8D5_9BACT|nr:hypothetical protein [Xanthocytophaga agilis]MDJ1503319.1 hypothetical protein [Xanthocytophaga agilis]
MKKHYPKHLFRSVIYDIEAYTSRKWLVKEIVENQYPTTFHHAVLESQIRPKRQRIVVSNVYAPIFGIVDADLLENNGFFKAGFVREPEIEQALTLSLTSHHTEYNILTPEVLNLSFASEAELEYKLKQIGVERKEIELTLSTIRCNQFDYRLFHGENIGYELFNHWDD